MKNERSEMQGLKIQKREDKKAGSEWSVVGIKN